MKKLTLVILLVVVGVTGMGSIAAQTATPAAPASTPVATTPGSDVQALFVVCADSAVLNFSGAIRTGYDIYYQVFSGTSGDGTALTNVRQVPVDGSFAVSDIVNFNSGVTVVSGGQGSATISVARESNSSSVEFSFVVTDVQDGCNNPTNTVVTSVDTGAGASSTSSTTGTAGVTTNILAPNGGVLNPNLSSEPDVVIGARLSDRFRSETPGLIFAECDAYPLAEPGLLYDNDTITIFWSWFAKTQEAMQQHLDNAVYTVQLNTASLPMTTRSEPVLRNGNYWVFYTARVGNLRPGHYEVGYLVTWRNTITDGYDNYGPNTANPRLSNICNFDIRPNPSGESIDHSGMYFPTNYPVHNILTDDTVNPALP